MDARRQGWRWLVALCVWLAVSLAQAADIQVEVERNPVGMGEEFSLVFSANGPLNGSPDFSVLSPHFQVVGTSNSTNIQIINGSTSQRSIWRVRVYATATGQLEIPPVAFGADKSPAVKLTVLDEAPQPGPAQAQNDILVELEAEPKSPFVQQEVIVTQRLMHSVALLPSQASMSHPELVGGKGLIQQLGKVSNRTLVRNGVTYQVIERRYAVFPQTSGTLSLGRTVFEGVLDDPASRQRDPFGMRGKHVRRFSQPLDIQVLPQASTGADQWLPARSLTLNAYWQPPSDQLKAGEPVTLTLAIVAEGLLAEQLPALTVKPPLGNKAYSNQPEFRNDLNGDHVIGIREEKGKS
ncbi:MAG: BatD family protein [Thiolinea sp.]